MNEEKGTMDRNFCKPRSRKWWFLIPVFVIAMVFVVGYVVMLIWNAVMPHVFTSLGPITYCQAILIFILSRVLFGGGFRRGGGGWRRGGHFGRGREWKEKWMSMSEEERAKFKEEWKNRCC
jgi:hypothetical protein